MYISSDKKINNEQKRHFQMLYNRNQFVYTLYKFLAQQLLQINFINI